jgi:hypothetical protein
MNGRPNWTAAMVTRLHVGEVLGVLRKTAISAQLRNGSLTTPFATVCWALMMRASGGEGYFALPEAIPIGALSALQRPSHRGLPQPTAAEVHTCN